jgi:RNA polymerase sigma-70 factor (ECF subfamily)
MTPEDLPSRLSQILTRWTLVFQAHETLADQAAHARQELAQRYLGAIYRYLLGAVRDPHLADDLAGEFALRLARGDLERATPERGRFRDLVKTILRNLVTDHFRKKRPMQLADGVEPTGPDGPGPEFDEDWRQELLNRAWEALQAQEKQTGQPFYSLLRLKADRPERRSAELAEELSSRLGKPVSEAAVRKTLQRAREKFSELLFDEVGRSICSRALDDIEAELAALNLLTYCKPALDRLRGKDV